MNKIVIYSGGFHPFTPAHKKVYDHISEYFDTDTDDIYVATSDSTKNRPFNFEQKQFIMIEAGVFEDEIVKVEQPYSPKEILNKYNKENTVCVFVVSKKDSDRFEDSEQYEEYSKENREFKPFKEKYYVYYCPEYSFVVNNKATQDASQVRELYKQTNDDEEKTDLLKELYPESKDISKLKEIFDAALGKKNFKTMINEVKAGYDDWGFITQRGEIIDGTRDKTARFHRELFQKIVKSKKALKYFTKEQIEEIYRHEDAADDYIPLVIASEYGWVRYFIRDGKTVVFDLVMGNTSSSFGSRELTYRQRRAILEIINKYSNKENFRFSLYRSNRGPLARQENLTYSEFLSIIL